MSPHEAISLANGTIPINPDAQEGRRKTLLQKEKEATPPPRDILSALLLLAQPSDFSVLQGPQNRRGSGSPGEARVPHPVPPPSLARSRQASVMTPCLSDGFDSGCLLLPSPHPPPAHLSGQSAPTAVPLRRVRTNSPTCLCGYCRPGAIQPPSKTLCLSSPTVPFPFPTPIGAPTGSPTIPTALHTHIQTSLSTLTSGLSEQ